MEFGTDLETLSAFTLLNMYDTGSAEEMWVSHFQ